MKHYGIENTGTTYRIVNGKLVEIKESKKDKKKNKNKHHQGSDSYNFYDSEYYKNLMKTKVPTKEDDNLYRSNCEGYCNDCVHRDEKLKIEEMNKTPNNGCLDNYELDFSNYNKWGW